jgi:ribonuclease P protein subunit POP4
MKVTPDIIRYEFIGTQVKVAQSLHQDYIGLSGRVVDETRNTFTLLDAGKARSVIKEFSVFNFTFDDGTVVDVDGKLLVGRPEDRLKKSVKRLW